MFNFRIKEEPSEIHFPELDEIDEVNEAEQLLNLEGKKYYRFLYRSVTTLFPLFACISITLSLRSVCQNCISENH